jgi:hypothetical protein
MFFVKSLSVLLVVATISISHGDEISKKTCEQFLPAFSDTNIGLILNRIKVDLPESEKSGKQFAKILKIVNDIVSKSTQERCDKGTFPVMDLTGCYDKCKSEVSKEVTGTFAWNYQTRTFYTNECYSACTGAYVAQNAITRTLRKADTVDANCKNPAIVDSRKLKQMENVLEQTDHTNVHDAVSK